MKKWITIGVAMVCALAAGAFFMQREPLETLKTEAFAPDFTLQGHDGKTYKLSDYKGKTVVLEWYNDDCPYVVKHYDSNTMQTLQKDFQDKVVWFSIISSAPGKQGHVDAEGATKLKETRQSFQTAILLDPKGDVGRSYGAKTTPHMYIIDEKGTLQYQGAIDDKPSTKMETLKDAKPLFKDALTQVLAGKALALRDTKPYGCSVKY